MSLYVDPYWKGVVYLEYWRPLQRRLEREEWLIELRQIRKLRAKRWRSIPKPYTYPYGAGGAALAGLTPAQRGLVNLLCEQMDDWTEKQLLATQMGDKFHFSDRPRPQLVQVYP